MTQNKKVLIQFLAGAAFFIWLGLSFIFLLGFGLLLLTKPSGLLLVLLFPAAGIANIATLYKPEHYKI